VVDSFVIFEILNFPARFLKDVEMPQTFKNWICIGRAEEVFVEGSYIAKTVCNEPIVVVNIGEGKLAAYFNVCRHHAAQICDEGIGQLDPVKKVRRNSLLLITSHVCE
jgi:phenylpropionate dioxygenase-like ring-hydroxylating dioxygenase large terminal subunit